MNERSPKITISIVTLDRRDVLEMCLWHLYETSDDSERDIWIWDNGSSDDTSAFLGTLVGWPGVRVFRSPTNVGGGPPRRSMIPFIRTPYLFTLDDDCWIITRGWVSAAVSALEFEPSIGQLVMPQGYVHPTSNYGIVHTQLEKPFFRVPYILPRSRIETYPEGGKSEPWFLGAETEADYEVKRVGEGRVAFPPSGGSQFRFACPGGCSIWRTDDVRSVLNLEANPEAHPTEDLRTAWGFKFQERGLCEAVLLDYGLCHMSPAPLWYIGRNETYWEHRADIAESIYGRSADTQRSWLKAAREASGWGRSLEDPDVLR